MEPSTSDEPGNRVQWHVALLGSAVGTGLGVAGCLRTASILGPPWLERALWAPALQIGAVMERLVVDDQHNLAAWGWTVQETALVFITAGLVARLLGWARGRRGKECAYRFLAVAVLISPWAANSPGLVTGTLTTGGAVVPLVTIACAASLTLALHLASRGHMQVALGTTLIGTAASLAFVYWLNAPGSVVLQYGGVIASAVALGALLSGPARGS